LNGKEKERVKKGEPMQSATYRGRKRKERRIERTKNCEERDRKTGGTESRDRKIHEDKIIS
jgi:hypothetical protein